MALGTRYRHLPLGGLVWACISISLGICTIHSRRAGVRFLAIYLLVNPAAALASWAIRVRRLRASASWPSASGVVHSAKLRKDWKEYPFGGAYMLRVQYSYDPGDGRRIAFEERRFWREAKAEAAAARLRVNQERR